MQERRQNFVDMQEIRDLARTTSQSLEAHIKEDEGNMAVIKEWVAPIVTLNDAVLDVKLSMSRLEGSLKTIIWILGAASLILGSRGLIDFIPKNAAASLPPAIVSGK